MTTPQDPFAQTPSGDSPPPNPAPGMLGGGTTPADMPTAPPPVGGPQGTNWGSGWAPERPTALAWWTIGLTGLVTLLTIASAFTAPADVENLKNNWDEMTQSLTGGTSPLQFLGILVQIGAFVVLALWMQAIRNNWRAQNVEPGGPPALEWWGWFVPLANFVLPFLGMRAINQRIVSVGVLLGWWIPFCAMWVVSFMVGVANVAAMDITNGELTNPDALDPIVTYTYIGAIATFIAWGFLAVIVRRITADHIRSADSQTAA